MSPTPRSRSRLWRLGLLLLCLGAGLWVHFDAGERFPMKETPEARGLTNDADSPRIWARAALAALEEGRPLVLHEDGHERQWVVVPDQLYHAGRRSADRMERLSGGGLSSLLAAASHLDASGAWPGLLLRPASVKNRESGAGQPVVLTERWLLQVVEPAGARKALEDAGFSLVDEPAYAPDRWIVASREGGAVGGLKAAAALQGHPAIADLTPLLRRQRQKSAAPNDPYYPLQWHLQSSGNNAGKPGTDLRVLPVWEQGIRGQGVRIAIVDDGLDLTHPDLLTNLDTVNDYDWNDAPPDDNPTPDPFNEDFHGTAVAGLAAARGDNAIGVSGVAPQATLVGFRLIADFISDADEAEAALRGNDLIQIKNHSWGAPPTILDPDYFAELGWSGPLLRAARRSAALDGRGGLGTIFVWSAGNDRDYGDQGNKDSYPNSIYGIPVGVLTTSGALAGYSEGGSHLVVCAPGSSGVVTTDLYGNAGYNNGITPGELSGELAARDYTRTFGGTSAAAPMVSGVIALMLEANPNLGWRDVKEILLRSSVQLAPTSPGWISRSGGEPDQPLIRHHESYGAGAVDAAAAVELAGTWQNLGPMVEHAKSQSPVIAIPDNSSPGISLDFNFSDVPNLRVEHVTVRLHAAHAYRGDLQIQLTSPSGTISTLASRTGSDDGQDYDDWTFSSVRHWGESAKGVWTLNCRDLARGDTGVLLSATVTLFGSEIEPVVLTQVPDSKLVGEGNPAVFTAAADGDGSISYAWRREGGSMDLGTAASYSIPAAQLADAGHYRVAVSNATGLEESTPVSLGVLRRSVAGQQVNEGKTAVFRAAAAGPGLELRWHRDGEELSDDGRVSGSGGAILTVRDCGEADIGNYTCRATMDELELETLPAFLDVRLRPVIQSPVLPVTGVSGPVELQLVAANDPVRYTIQGLPRGLKYDRNTGLIAGTPDREGLYTIRVSASNGAGTGPLLTFDWVIDALSNGVLGTFEGLVARDATLNQSLGGRMLLKVSPTGTFTGSLLLGTMTHRFAARLEASPGADPQARVTLKRAGGQPPLVLQFDIADGELHGTIGTEEGGVSVDAFQFEWDPQVHASLQGPYTTRFLPAPDDLGNPLVPQGAGYMAGNLSSKGSFKGAGRLPDGGSFTLAIGRGQGGRLPVLGRVGKTATSLRAWLVQDESEWNPEPGDFAGEPDLQRSGQTAHELDIRGAAYLPVGNLFEFLDLVDGSAEAVLRADGIEETLRQDFLIMAPSKFKTAVDNPNRLTLRANSKTGVFSGSIVIPGSKAAPISGVFVRAQDGGAGQGIGQFLQPRADEPPLSGRIDLQAQE